MQEDQVGQGSSKKARTYVKRQKEYEPTCSKYVNRFVSDSEGSVTEDTSVTKAYAESEQESEDPNDDIVSLPDQEVPDKNVEELLCENTNKQNKSKKQEESKIVSLMASVKNLSSGKTLGILLQMQNKLIS